MRKLSTGQDSTLENWIALASVFFGENSKATEFLRNKAKESPNGEKEEVIADEGQLIMALMKMETDDRGEKETHRIKCKGCQEEIEVKVRQKDLEDFYKGIKHIQDAAPYLTADERELFISGICGKCFDEMFADE